MYRERELLAIRNDLQELKARFGNFDLRWRCSREARVARAVKYTLMEALEELDGYMGWS